MSEKIQILILGVILLIAGLLGLNYTFNQLEENKEDFPFIGSIILPTQHNINIQLTDKEEEIAILIIKSILLLFLSVIIIFIGLFLIIYTLYKKFRIKSSQ